MAVVPREELTFTFFVEQYFLALKGRGLLLSAEELALVQQWEATGVPVWVVCEAIRTAFEAYRAKRGANARPPASLRFCRKPVQRALEAWRSGRVGASASASGSAGTKRSRLPGGRSRRAARRSPGQGGQTR